jgi:1,4-dihydroxy-2-naphthoyl-CoA hydrolase
MAIWYGNPTLQELNDSRAHTLMESLGIKITEIGEDYLTGTMPVDDRTRQPRGFLHGGASLALAETLGSYASALCVDLDSKTLFGQEINANHVRPVSEGLVVGTARPYHLGRTSHVWEIRINSEQGQLVCISRLTVSIQDK